MKILHMDISTAVAICTPPKIKYTTAELLNLKQKAIIDKMGHRHM